MATTYSRFETFRLGYGPDGVTMGLWQKNYANYPLAPTQGPNGSVAFNNVNLSPTQILSPLLSQIALAGTVTTLGYRAWGGEVGKFHRWNYVRSIRHGLGYKPLVHVSPRGPQRIGCYADREYLHFGLQTGTVAAAGFVPDGSQACPLPAPVDYVVYGFGIQTTATQFGLFQFSNSGLSSGNYASRPPLASPAKPDAKTSLDYWEFYTATQSYTYGSSPGTNPSAQAYSMRTDIGYTYVATNNYVSRGQYYGAWTSTANGTSTTSYIDYRNIPGVLQFEPMFYSSSTAYAAYLASLPPMPSS